MQLTVIGAYLPRFSPERLTAWIEEDVQSFSTGIRAMKSQGLAQSWSEEEIESRAAELPEELQEALSAAALFEVLVEDHVGDFDPFAIFEIHTTSVAWEPAYLSLDGTYSIAEHIDDLTDVKSFRVAFYVHEWPKGGELVGPMGSLIHPPFVETPERLWKLAPYALLN
jgi:hypothetical protein